MKEHYIGIDAGGTKSEAVIVNQDLRILAEGIYEGMNVRQMNPNTVSRIVKTIIDDLTYRAGLLPYHAGLTILAAAGAGDAKIREQVEYACEGRMPQQIVKVITDAEAALAAAFGAEPGIVVISGTGSIAWGKDESGQVMRAGGHGYILGDEGSGFWIGREAVRKSLDGFHRGEDLPLAEKICQLWEIDDVSQAVSVVYNDEKPAYKAGTLAPIVFEAADTGDDLCRSILKDAAGELINLAEAITGRVKFRGLVNLCFSGSIANKLREGGYFEDIDSIANYDINEPLYQPAIGAVIARKE